MSSLIQATRGKDNTTKITSRRWVSLLRSCSLSLAMTTACTGETAGSPTSSPADLAPAPSATTVGVYYYPWYGGNFHGGHYMRERLVPPQLPVLGAYDDRDASVIASHLDWSREANVSLWVASWWGPGKREDTTLLQHILPHEGLGQMRIALFYETSGRIPEFTDVTNVAADMAYMAEHYFHHPNYLRIDGRPVLFVYLTRVLTRNGMLATVVERMRAAAGEAGFELYIVGDEVFGAAPASAPGVALLDAVTNYDVYGSMGARGYAGQEAVDAYYAAQADWQSLAHDNGTAFIPAATPGFNDKGVREGHAAVSRRLSPTSEHGTLFRAMLQQAVTLTETATGKLLLVTSWNEWHEDTQIEPVVESPPTRADDSGQALSEGLDYEGYGSRYLHILREETAK